MINLCYIIDIIQYSSSLTCLVPFWLFLLYPQFMYSIDVSKYMRKMAFFSSHRVLY